MANTPQFGFLEEFVLELLKLHGFDNLTERQKLAYVPQLTVQLEERLGLELMPRLTDDQLEEFAAMVERDGVTDMQWREFWTKTIPNFDEEVKKECQAFADDMKNILAHQRAPMA